jgi:hypothetical protein
METTTIGKVVDILGSSSVDTNSQTEPNQYYCFVKETNSIGIQIPKGSPDPQTFAQVCALDTYQYQVKAQLASTDVEFVGCKMICQRWYIVQDILGQKSVIMEGYRCEVFIHDKGGIEPMTIIAVCIGVGIILSAIAIAYQIFKLSPEQVAALAEQMIEAAKDTGIGLIIVFAVVIFLILYLTRGSLSVGKGRTSMKLSAGKAGTAKAQGGNLKV